MEKSFNDIIIALGVIGIAGFFVCLMVFIIEYQDTLIWKNKIVNPPDLSPAWIFLLPPCLILMFILFGAGVELGIICLIAAILANILQRMQNKTVKKIHAYQQTKEYVFKNIKIKSDSFKKSYSFDGPNIFCKTTIGPILCSCFTVGLEGGKGFLAFCGIFNDKYNFSSEAYDNQGNKICISLNVDKAVTSYQTSYKDSNRKITNQRGDVIGEVEGATHYETHYCTNYTESFKMIFPIETAKKLENGYQVKLYGDTDVIVDIPCWYIQAFLEGISSKPEFKKINWL